MIFCQRRAYKLLIAEMSDPRGTELISAPGWHEPVLRYRKGRPTRMPNPILQLGYGLPVIGSYDAAVVYYQEQSYEAGLELWLCKIGRIWRPRIVPVEPSIEDERDMVKFEKLVREQPDVFARVGRTYVWRCYLRGGLLMFERRDAGPEPPERFFWWPHFVWMTDVVTPLRRISDAEVIALSLPERSRG